MALAESFLLMLRKSKQSYPYSVFKYIQFDTNLYNSLLRHKSRKFHTARV